MAMYDNAKHLEGTFTPANLSDYMLKAQSAELIELSKIILEKFKQKGKALRILDVGIGDGRVLKNFFVNKEVWQAIKEYNGIDNSQDCLDLSAKLIKELKLEDKVIVKFLDAVNLDQIKEKYDLIITTFFTAGNFYPFDYDLKTMPAGYDLSQNDKFTQIFRKAYQLLEVGGEIVIGSVYIDNDRTREKQESWYKGLGWQIVTNETDSYTANSDGWWSQRFTKQRIYDYLSFIDKEKISFIPLDQDDFAMMVRIKK